MRHRSAPRRSLAAFTAAGVAGAFGLTAAVLTTTAHAAGAPAALAYHVGSAGSDMVEPWFTVTNTSGQTLNLSTVKIRYYFTIDSASSYQYTCEWAQIGCGNLTGTIGTLPAPSATADHYLEVGFSGGSLAPGASTGDMQLRMNAADWAPVNQANDYSFTGRRPPTGPSGTITLAVNGAIVSGTAPGGNPPPTSPSSSPSTNPPPPGRRRRPDAVRRLLLQRLVRPEPRRARLDRPHQLGRTRRLRHIWSAGTITFPADPSAARRARDDLSASTNGTAAGTNQAEIDTSSRKFFEGTYAARVYFNDAPSTGPNGDQ